MSAWFTLNLLRNFGISPLPMSIGRSPDRRAARDTDIATFE